MRVRKCCAQSRTGVDLPALVAAVAYEQLDVVLLRQFRIGSDEIRKLGPSRALGLTAFVAKLDYVLVPVFVAVTGLNADGSTDHPTTPLSFVDNLPYRQSWPHEMAARPAQSHLAGRWLGRQRPARAIHHATPPAPVLAFSVLAAA
jgi:hypothetical protein